PPEEHRLYDQQQLRQQELGDFRTAHPDATKPLGRARLRITLQAVVLVLASIIDVVLLRAALEYLLTEFFSLDQARLLSMFVPVVLVTLEAIIGYQIGCQRLARQQDQAGLAGIGPLPAGIGRQPRHLLWEIAGLLLVF